MDGPTNSNIKWASTKLIDEGFKYNHDMKSILDDSLKNVRRLMDYKCLLLRPVWYMVLEGDNGNKIK